MLRRSAAVPRPGGRGVRQCAAGLFRRLPRPGGAPIPEADAGFELPVIGPYRIRILLWAGDDEFPASAQILYSDQFTCGFTAEDSVVAAELLLDSLCGQLPRK